MHLQSGSWAAYCTDKCKQILRTKQQTENWTNYMKLTTLIGIIISKHNLLPVWIWLRLTELTELQIQMNLFMWLMEILFECSDLHIKLNKMKPNKKQVV